MPFKKMEKPAFPPRHWVLVGFPGSGKSTFATQMHTPLLPVDADHRFEEVIHLAQGEVYELSDNRADAVDPETISRLLDQNMPGSGVKTIIVDSLTTIITPKVTEAIMESDARRARNETKGRGEKKENLIAPFKDKALAMRLLQDAVTKWGTDTLWIYHLQDSRDENAQKVTRPILSQTERARLYRSINMELHIIQEQISGSKKERHGVKVVWARRGHFGMTLWDDTGHWEGMPEKIEQAVYGGLSVADQDKLEKEAPAVFATEEAAIDWAVGRDVFKNVEHARNAWEKIKRENPNLDLARWSKLWTAEVENREATKQAGGAEAPTAHTQAEVMDDFGNFCYQVMVEVGFFESAEEITQALAHLNMAYNPQEEVGLMEMLRLHVQALPAFTTLEKLLFQIHEDFGLGESEAKARLKALNFGGFPRGENGEARSRSRRMYWAVLMTTPKKQEKKLVKELAEEDIPF